MSNVHVIHEQDASGDLVDIHYFCHADAQAVGAAEWPAPEALDYQVFCKTCGDLLPVPLTAEGRAAQPLYFAWDDDVAIPFRLNDHDEMVVDAAALVRMAESCIWRISNGDEAERQTAAQAIGTIREFTRHYRQDINECILPEWYKTLPRVDEEGNDIT